MNTGGSYQITNGKRELVEQTKPQKTLTHQQKIDLATGVEKPQKSQSKPAKKG